GAPRHGRAAADAGPYRAPAPVRGGGAAAGGADRLGRVPCGVEPPSPDRDRAAAIDPRVPQLALDVVDRRIGVRAGTRAAGGRVHAHSEVRGGESPVRGDLV